MRKRIYSPPLSGVKVSKRLLKENGNKIRIGAGSKGSMNRIKKKPRRSGAFSSFKYGRD
jgi:hypothetical protein